MAGTGGPDERKRTMAAHLLAALGVLWLLGFALMIVGASAAPEYESIWGEYDDES